MPIWPTMDDLTALAIAAGRGDRAALDRLVRASQGAVWRYCRHMVGADAADDATQETFIRAIRTLPSFGARSSALTWLISIARRACADWVRAQQRSRRLRDRLQSVVAGHPSTSTPSDRVDLDVLVGMLPDERREAFVLSQVLGFSYHEVALICDCPVGTVRSRIARARIELLEYFQIEGNQLRAEGD